MIFIYSILHWAVLKLPFDMCCSEYALLNSSEIYLGFLLG